MVNITQQTMYTYFNIFRWINIIFCLKNWLSLWIIIMPFDDYTWVLIEKNILEGSLYLSYAVTLISESANYLVFWCGYF